MKIRTTPSINEANILFLALGLVLLVFGSMVQQRDIYTGILVTEYILILIPNLLYLKIRGYSMRETLGLYPISPKQSIHIFFIMIFAYPIAVFLNYMVIVLVNSVSEAMPIGVPIPTSWQEYVLSLFIIAVTPGICEEVMFRGTMQSAYSDFGHKKAIIFSALLFGVFHFNLLNLMGPFFLGIVLGIIRFRTGSLYGAILGHTVNNGIALSLGFFLSRVSDPLLEASEQAPVLPQGMDMAVTLIVLAGWALFSFVVLYLLLKNLPANFGQEALEEHRDETQESLETESQSDERIIWSPIIIIAGIFVVLNYRYFFLI